MHFTLLYAAFNKKFLDNIIQNFIQQFLELLTKIFLI